MSKIFLFMNLEKRGFDAETAVEHLKKPKHFPFIRSFQLALSGT
jgi:hypothetical protein